MNYRTREQVRPIDLRFMWVVIVALGACLLVGLVVPMDRLDGKGWPARALTYPLSALVVPAIWVLRGRRSPFPALANGLLVLPFVLDLAGNLFGLFDIHSENRVDRPTAKRSRRFDRCRCLGAVATDSIGAAR